VTILVVAYMRRAFLLESISLVVANLGIGIFLPAVWHHLKPYQQRRVTNFLDPDSDSSGAGWQVIQSKIAIGSGGFHGKGYLEGSQKALDYLPAKHTDFIFSVLGEELGFVGALAILLVFGVLITGPLLAAQKMKSEFARRYAWELRRICVSALRQHRHDHRHRTGRGYSAAVHQLRRKLHAGELFPHRACSSTARLAGRSISSTLRACMTMAAAAVYLRCSVFRKERNASHTGSPGQAPAAFVRLHAGLEFLDGHLARATPREDRPASTRKRSST
jgi:hypothetical protein